MNLSTNELALILSALQNENRTLQGMMNDLERRMLHNGDMNVSIAKRMNEVNSLFLKIEEEMLSH